MTQTLFTGLAAAWLSACVAPSEIEEIKKNQKEIIAKLDEISKKGPAMQAQRPPMPARPADDKVYSFDVGPSAVKGPADAWITIIEVSDFQCPFCQRVGPTLAEVQKKYGNDVRIAFKHNPLPFHQRALPAAMAAECANEQGKFWNMHDKMFENQRALEDADLEKYAKEVGLDTGKWKSCYSSGKFKEQILADQKRANELGARGTPAFFINGRYLSGAQPFDRFAALIDEELAKAKKSGIAKNDYYKKSVVEKGEKTI